MEKTLKFSPRLKSYFDHLLKFYMFVGSLMVLVTMIFLKSSDYFVFFIFLIGASISGMILLPVMNLLANERIYLSKDKIEIKSLRLLFFRKCLVFNMSDIRHIWNRQDGSVFIFSDDAILPIYKSFVGRGGRPFEEVLKERLGFGIDNSNEYVDPVLFTPALEYSNVALLSALLLMNIGMVLWLKMDWSIIYRCTNCSTAILNEFGGLFGFDLVVWVLFYIANDASLPMFRKFSVVCTKTTLSKFINGSNSTMIRKDISDIEEYVPSKYANPLLRFKDGSKWRVERSLVSDKTKFEAYIKVRIRLKNRANSGR